jgi:hypothetical protein
MESMTRAQQTQLITLAIIVAAVAFGLARRIRPQPVRPQRIAVTGVVVVLLLAASLVGSGLPLVENPIALALAPVFLAAGIGLGFVLVRTMSFWVDQPTGQLWMRGGALFAAILVGTIALRFGVRYVLTGNAFGNSALPTHATGSAALLAGLSADLIFLSLGLWASRAFLLVQRHRAFEAGSLPGRTTR